MSVRVVLASCSDAEFVKLAEAVCALQLDYPVKQVVNHFRDVEYAYPKPAVKKCHEVLGGDPNTAFDRFLQKLEALHNVNGRAARAAPAVAVAPAAVSHGVPNRV